MPLDYWEKLRLCAACGEGYALLMGPEQRKVNQFKLAQSQHGGKKKKIFIFI